jgi:glutamyl-tRNA reductase
MTAARLKGWKGAELIFVNRSESGAQALADLHGGRVIPFKEFQARSCDFDALVSGASVSEFLLTPKDFQHLSQGATSRLLLDLGVPQNMDPAVGELNGFDYLDVLGLGRKVEASRREIELLIRRVRPLLRDGLQSFREKLFQKALAPVANQMRASVEARAEMEVDRWLKRHLGHLEDQDQDLVHQLGKRVASQSVQIPLAALRRTLRELPLGEELIGSIETVSS